MEKVFAVVCNQYAGMVEQNKLFSTKEKAIAAIKKIADARRYRSGVQVFVDREDRFSYLFGWEEHEVTFTIEEMSVE